MYTFVKIPEIGGRHHVSSPNFFVEEQRGVFPKYCVTTSPMNHRTEDGLYVTPGFLVCLSLGGRQTLRLVVKGSEDEDERGHYCSSNS